MSLSVKTGSVIFSIQDADSNSEKTCDSNWNSIHQSSVLIGRYDYFVEAYDAATGSQ